MLAVTGVSPTCLLTPISSDQAAGFTQLLCVKPFISRENIPKLNVRVITCWNPEDQKTPDPSQPPWFRSKTTALQTVWTFLRFTFLTTVLILSVNIEVARTLGEPGQDDKLHDCRDTRGGQQDGPVFFSAQKLSVESHATQRFSQSDERPPPVQGCCQTIAARTWGLQLVRLVSQQWEKWRFPFPWRHGAQLERFPPNTGAEHKGRCLWHNRTAWTLQSTSLVNWLQAQIMMQDRNVSGLLTCIYSGEEPSNHK